MSFNWSKIELRCDFGFLRRTAPRSIQSDDTGRSHLFFGSPIKIAYRTPKSPGFVNLEDKPTSRHLMGSEPWGG